MTLGPGGEKGEHPRLIRGRARARPADQGTRPALPGHLHRVRDETPRGGDAAELTVLADHQTAHGLVLEMLAGLLPGMYDPSGPDRLLFAFFAAMAETERENIRESTLEGLDAAARKGKHGGRPPRHHRRHAAHRAAAPGEPRGRSSPT
ncbi:recombinase family protein [Streptomyces clavifer]|uniref:recombinase family protein n=1 Tax=Streptomyces clavifer TaxID=68188 RepID=UPI0037FB3ABF